MSANSITSLIRTGTKLWLDSVDHMLAQVRLEEYIWHDFSHFFDIALIISPRRRQKLQHTWVVNLRDRLGAPLGWRNKVERLVGGQSLANLFGPPRVLERLVRRRSLDFDFWIMQQVCR